MRSRLARAAAILLLLWLGAVAAVDFRFGEGWRVADIGRGIAAVFSTGQFDFSLVWPLAKTRLFGFFFVLASFGLGVPFAHAALGPEQRRRERWFAGTLLGTAGLGLLVFALGVAGLWGRITAPALLGGLAVQAVINIGRERKGLWRDLRRLLGAARAGDWIFLSVAALVGILLFAGALAPPIQSDALRYHLAAPAEWIKARRIFYLSGSAFSNFPFLVEMNFALALLLGLPAGAHLVHLVYLALSCCALGLIAESLARRGDESDARRSRFPHAGVAAACLLLTNPVAGPLATWAFVDVGSLAYLLAMIWAIARWAERPGPRGLALAAAFGGAAFATKYTNLLPVALGTLAVGILAWRAAPAGRRIKLGLLAAVRFGLLAVTICTPWLARNVITTGNPVYPLAYERFDGRDWSEENAAFYRMKAGEKGTAEALLRARAQERESKGRPRPDDEAWRRARNETMGEKALRLALLPWHTYRWPTAFEDWALGPLFLFMAPVAAVVGLVGLWRRRGQKPEARSQNDGESWSTYAWLSAIFIVFLFLTWAATYQSSRFLLPVCALLAAFLAAWGAAPRGGTPSRVFARWGACLVLLSQSLWTARYVTAHEPNPLPCAFARESPESYLNRSLNYYAAADWVNRNSAPGETVLLAGEHRTFYFDAPFYRLNPPRAADWFDTPAVLRLLRETPNPDAALDRLLAHGTTLIVFNYAELFAPLALASEQTLESARDESERPEVMARFVAEGPSSVLGGGVPLGQGGTNYDYLRRRFSGEEWALWTRFALSPRLETVYSPEALVRVCRIRPR
ncbi:MAG: hypothetical protein NTW86_20450 [Candidatus Sumerlaeota bacterium]|nr:hypothetical protein [Candidatus Sumerlaeota bacterium]